MTITFIHSNLFDFLSYSIFHSIFYYLGMLENFRVAEDMPIESDIVVTALDKVSTLDLLCTCYSCDSCFAILCHFAR